MALALDASTPLAVTSNAQTLTTASFTPPSGSVLYVCAAINSSSGGGFPNSVSGVTDNLVTHLTYTPRAQFGTENGNDALVYLYTAPVASSAAMTVSVAETNASATGRFGMLRVLVVSGADNSSPVGTVSGGRGLSTNIVGTTARYICARGGSWGWLLTGDWAQKGVPTVPTDETVDAQYDVAGEDTYSVIKKNATTASAGSEVILSTITPNSAAQISYVYFEMLPATVTNSGNSVPSGTALTTPAFTAKFLFFDTGDYGIGV